MTTKLAKIRNREKHLQEHISRAQAGLSRLGERRESAEYLASLADDFALDTKTSAWKREGFILDLYFHDKPKEALDYAGMFDEFNLYHGGGHASSSSEHSWHIRVRAQVKY